MGNAQTSVNEAVLSFLFIFLVVYGLGTAYALRAYASVGEHVFTCGERPKDRKLSKRGKRHRGPKTIVDNKFVNVPEAELDAEEGIVTEGAREMSWYEGLYKTKGFPGTIVYVVSWVLAYFLLAYVTWRIWINVPAQENVYGIVFLYFFVVHILAIGLASFLLFEMQNLTFATLGKTLELLTSVVGLTMIGLLTFETDDLLPSVTLFVLYCIHVFIVFASWICVIILAVKNRHAGTTKRVQKYNSLPVDAPAY